jgi:hypothetical protein
MFCPSCGKENPVECKFCASCGFNLEVISRALYTNSVGLYTKFDTALNNLIARYSERVFKNAPTAALSRKLSDSWKVLGEGILTVPVDFALFWLMLFVIFPLRLLTILISTPFRLLTSSGSAPFRRQMEESNRPKALASPERVQSTDNKRKSEISEWRIDSAISAVEHTTEHLPDYHRPMRSTGE